MVGQEPIPPVDIGRAEITGVVLAGGRAMRMDGLDKGLQLFGGVPLALHALQRLRLQVGPTMINANRHLEQYRAFGVPVWPDLLPGYAGPLAGVASALRHCNTRYLVTVPCDAPLFPADLVPRLAQALAREACEIAMACAVEISEVGQRTWRPQPVFCLLHQDLLASLEQFIAGGGRKVTAWTAQHRTAPVPFDSLEAFSNINTLAQLHAMRG